MNVPGASLIWTSVGALRARAQLAATSSAARVLGAMVVFCATATCIYLGFRSCNCFDLQYDDAYITFRYAHNLASGKGLVFNPGDPTDSASSFLYTVLLAGLELIGLSNLPRVAATIGVASAACIAALVYVACLERTRRPWLSSVLALAVGTHGLISGWSLSGMETLFYSVLVTAVVFRLFVLRSFGWVDAALIFAVVLTRFEGVLLAAAWGCLACVHLWRGTRTQRRYIAAHVVAVCVALAAFLALKYALYGTIIPHAFALKTITQLYAPNPGALWEVWRANALGLLLLAAAGVFSVPRRVESVAFIAYVLASVVSLVVGPFADWARYSVHLVPVAAILGCVPLSRLLRRAAPVALALLALICVGSYDSFRGRLPGFMAGAGHARCRAQVGKFLERSLEPGTLVLSSDIGVIAYAAPSIRFVDAVGLTSKDVLLARMRGENLDHVLFEAKPLVLADTCGGSCARVEDFAANNWLTLENYWLTPLPAQHFSAHLQRGQMLERCSSPDGLSFGVARFELVP